MSYLTAFGKSVLVLHTAEVIKDLLEKRAKIYSHRPHTVMGGEIYGLDNVSVHTYLQGYIRDLCSFWREDHAVFRLQWQVSRDS